MSSSSNANLTLPRLYVQENGEILDEQGRNREDSLLLQKNFYFAKNGSLRSEAGGEEFLVSYFDQPLIAKEVKYLDAEHLEFNGKFVFKVQNLTLDEWDRFCGLETSSGIPFVMHPDAQNQFFDLLDSFTDDSITYQGREIFVPPYFSDHMALREVSSENYWNKRYQDKNFAWDLGEAHPALVRFGPTLKLPKSRVLVLGSGGGHDAHWFLQQGHLVTLVDISEEAIKLAEQNYPGANWQKLKSDLFQLPTSMYQNFDLIFEHTLYCAIEPRRRQKLVSLWNQLLSPQGLVLAVLFAMEKRTGPPFGGTPWEFKKRSSSLFRPLHFEYLKDSPASRMGIEVLNLLQKK